MNTNDQLLVSRELLEAVSNVLFNDGWSMLSDRIDKALAAQPAAVEPVAWMREDGDVMSHALRDYLSKGNETGGFTIPLFAHPPRDVAAGGIANKQFLADVMTAAGLLSCGKRDRGLAEHLGKRCMEISLTHPEPAGGVVSVQEAWKACGGNPGIKATKDELLFALRAMNEAEEGGVVLPERRKVHKYTVSSADGWNACLDEVAKLNRLTPK